MFNSNYNAHLIEPIHYYKKVIKPVLGLEKASIKSLDILPHGIYGNSNLLYNPKFLILGSLIQQRRHP
jgi:hypothetical protein